MQCEDSAEPNERIVPALYVLLPASLDTNSVDMIEDRKN